IAGAHPETWKIINTALQVGTRGLPGGLSIARLLMAAKGVTARISVPPLTVRQILAWADAFFKVHGDWPRSTSGPVDGAYGETWKNIDSALGSGVRGLPGKSSVFQLLRKHREIYPGRKGRQYGPQAAKRLSME